MSPRPLALVLGLTAGDYLLWNWSLSGNHDVPALVSGLTLPPLAAASMLLIKQFAQTQGVGKLGFVDPLLYRIANSAQGPQAFHDVTLGGNRFNNCTPGWDYSTGLGSPDVALLANAIVAQLKS